MSNKLYPLKKIDDILYRVLNNFHFSVNCARRCLTQFTLKCKLFKTLYNIQGVSKKRYFSDLLSYFSSRGRILLFHMCFGIRILSPFHLAIQKVSIQNLNCPKNAKNACADMIFIPAQSSLRKAGIKIMSAHAFLGQLRF